MKGLKRVTRRRDDALSRVDWDQLEKLLAAYYRSEGFQVEHVGTGATGANFDGGIDLKLRRGEQYIVVQCKHWNAMKVPHNAVHELLGVMVNEGATGAILATSGEFTRAAIEAATRLGHVQLVDGVDLRIMLGPIRAAAPAHLGPNRLSGTGAGGLAKSAGERLLAAVEDRIRHGARGRGAARTLGVWIGIKLLTLAFGLLLLALAALALTHLLSTLSTPRVMAPQPAARPAAVSTAQRDRPLELAVRNDAGCRELIDAPSGTIDHCTPRGATAAPSAAERRRQQRDADAAMKTIADSTPEM